MAPLLDQLGELNEAQLKELSARVSALLGSSGVDHANDEQVVHDVLCEALAAKGIETPHYGMVRRLPHYKAFAQGASVLAAFVTEHVQPPSRTHRRKAYMVLVKMLVRWLGACQIPVSHKTACLNLSKIASIADRQFPGYVESGLLGYALMGSAAA